MPLINDVAIVLRRLDYSESSQVLALFGRCHGKLRVIAKGVRRSSKKRFNPGLDLLDAGQLAASVRHVGQEALANLTEWKPTSAFFGLRQRLGCWQAAQYTADILATLTEDWDPHPVLYDELYHTLQTLSDMDDVLSTLVGFQRTLLEQTGLLPRLDVCAGCGRTLHSTRNIYFSSFEGGLLCRDCEPARVEKRLARVPRNVLAGATPANDADIAGLFDLFNYHISHVSGRPPAASAYLSDLADRARVPHR